MISPPPSRKTQFFLLCGGIQPQYQPTRVGGAASRSPGEQRVPRGLRRASRQLVPGGGVSTVPRLPRATPRRAGRGPEPRTLGRGLRPIMGWTPLLTRGRSRTPPSLFLATAKGKGQGANPGAAGLQESRVPQEPRPGSGRPGGRAQLSQGAGPRGTGRQRAAAAPTSPARPFSHGALLRRENTRSFLLFL